MDSAIWDSANWELAIWDAVCTCIITDFKAIASFEFFFLVLVSTNVLVPQNSYGINIEGAINAMDLNPGGSRIVVAGRNGILNIIYQTACHFVVFTLETHVANLDQNQTKNTFKEQPYNISTCNTKNVL